MYIIVHKSDPAWTQVDRVPGNENTVVCKLCRTKLSLGATKRNFSISSVKRHLESQHKSVFFTLYVKTSEDCVGELPAIAGNKRTREEIEELPDQGPLRTKKSRNFFLQKTLPETLENGQKLPIHSDKAQFIHKILFEYLMQDMVPFSAVSGRGFLRFCQVCSLTHFICFSW